MNLSLSQKLFIFICITLLLIILPLFYIARTSLTQFGNYAYSVNKEQIKNMSGFYLSRVAAEQAKKYDEIFKKAKSVSCLLGSSVSNIYNDIERLSSEGITESTPLELNQENRIFFSPRDEPVITAYWGDDSISNEIKKELKALSYFKPLMIKSRELVNESFATHIITASGIGCYYTINLKAKAACYRLPPPSQFDLREGEPFTIFSKQKNRYFETRWTKVYKDDVLDGLMITATTPVYDLAGNFKGITGIDLPVEYISNDLKEDPFIPGNENETILFAFLQDKKGKLIAFPRAFFDTFGLEPDFKLFKNSSDIFNYSLMDSSIEAVRMVGSRLIKTHNETIDLMLDNEKYVLVVGCLESVGWHLVLVARESGMTASVDKTRNALKKTIRTTWKNFMGFSLWGLVISVGLIVCAIRIFISPVRQFIEATQKVSKGDFMSTFQTDRKDEIGLLATSFNTMVTKLRRSEKKEKDHAMELESQISIRTGELEKTNKELNKIKNELEKIVAERTAQLKKLNEHLVFSEEMARKTIASDLHDSVTQTLAISISKLKNIQGSHGGIAEKDLLEVQRYLEQSVREIRSLIYQLSPPILDDFDIEIALGFLIEETNIKHNSCFHYINNIEDPVNLTHAVKVTLYRAVNEMVTNILKHASTKNGQIEISKTREKIRVRVEDQGAGFDVTMNKDSDTFGFGLHSLSERIENFGGEIIIVSEPGKGTKILLTIPFSSSKDKEHGKN